MRSIYNAYSFTVSPSTYLVALPVGLIAISGWLVTSESGSFLVGRRTSRIQQVARHNTSEGATSSLIEVEAAARLDHGRYAWVDPDSTAAGFLGSDSTARPLGSRPGTSASWLEMQTSTLSATRNRDLPPIPGTVEIADSEKPFFETVPADAGFHIAADEATRVDMQKKIVTFNGHVKLASPQFNLTSTKLVVHLGDDHKSFNLMEATGSVDVVLTGVPEDKKYRGQSGVAVYDTNKGTLTMTNWPKIQGSGQELVAAEESTRVILVPKTGKMTTEGRAQTRIAKRLMEESTAKR